MKLSFAAFVSALLVSAASGTALTKDDKNKLCYVYPDPHILTFHGIRYDFHGACDVVILKSESFRGVGLSIHSRDEPRGSWGGIQTIAMMLGDDVFEVDKLNNIWINGAKNPPQPHKIGQYDITQHDWQKDDGSFGSNWRINLGPDANGMDGQYIEFREWTLPGRWYDMLGVVINAHGSDFHDSCGLCGAWTKPYLQNREGTFDWNPTGIARVGNIPDMGNEWQVHDSDGRIFVQDPAVDRPSYCYDRRGEEQGERQGRRLMEGETVHSAEVDPPFRRFLQEEPREKAEFDLELLANAVPCEETDVGCITPEEAGEACKDAPEDMKDDCIFDVEAVNTPMVAASPFFEPTTDAGAGGDPHFHTFTGEYYAYHGVCDLVMVQSDNFAGGMGLDLHIRTEEREGYSSISNVAIKIGKDVLEIINDGSFALNGLPQSELPNEFGGFPIVKAQASENDLFLPDVNTGFEQHEFAEATTYDLVLGGGESIQVKLWKDYLWANVRGSNRNFFDARGLMGKWQQGRIGRDDVTKVEDPTAFAEEWQVKDTDPKLFFTERTPQYPQACIPPPPTSVSRRLGESKHAEDACAHVEGPRKEFCIFDVMVTQDVKMAGAYR